MLTCAAVAFDVPPFSTFGRPQAPRSVESNLPSTAADELRTSLPSPLAIYRPQDSALSEHLATQKVEEVEEQSFATLAARQTDDQKTSNASVHRLLTASHAQDSAAEVVGDLAKSSMSTVAVETTESQPTGAAEPVPTFVGLWAPDPGTCSARSFRDGALPALISTDGASAGETFCMFTDKKYSESGWTVVAKCSSPRERWTANVRLSVKDDRLTWTSKRGTQAYARCAPDVLLAAR